MPVSYRIDRLRTFAALAMMAALASPSLQALAQTADQPTKRQTQQKPPTKPRQTTTTTPKPAAKEAAKTEALPPS